MGELNMIGFARGSGKRIHIIVNNAKEPGNYTLCSANTKNLYPMEPEKDFDIYHVDCAKCKRTMFYKETLKAAQEEDKKNKKKKVVKKITNKQRPKEQKSQPKKETKKEDINEVVKDDNKQESSSVMVEETKTSNDCIMLDDPEKIPKDFLNQQIKQLNCFITQIISSVQGQFFAKQRVDFKYRIYHAPSGTVVFDEVGQDLIIQALTILNIMKNEWDGRQKASKPFISEMRESMKYAFLISGQTYPKTLDEKIQEQKTSVKKSKVVIKRRSKKPEPIKIRRRTYMVEPPVIKIRRRQPSL